MNNLPFKFQRVNKKNAKMHNNFRVDDKKANGIDRLKDNLSNNTFQNLFTNNGLVKPKKLAIVAIALCQMSDLEYINADQIHALICSWWRWLSSNDIISKSQVLRALKILNDLGVVIKVKERASFGNHRLSYYIPLNTFALLGLNLIKELNILRSTHNLSGKKSTAQIVTYKTKDNTLEISSMSQVDRSATQITLNNRTYLTNGKEIHYMTLDKNYICAEGQTPMNLDYQPSDKTLQRIGVQLDIGLKTINEQINKFVHFNTERKLTSFDWDKAFLKWIQNAHEEGWLYPDSKKSTKKGSSSTPDNKFVKTSFDRSKLEGRKYDETAQDFEVRWREKHNIWV